MECGVMHTYQRLWFMLTLTWCSHTESLLFAFGYPVTPMMRGRHFDCIVQIFKITTDFNMYNVFLM